MNIVIALCTAFSLGLGSTEASTKTEESLPGPVFVDGTVLLTNDGPTVVGSSITCCARLVDPDGNDVATAEYRFTWMETGYDSVVDVSNSTTSNFTRTYAEARERTVQIIVSLNDSQRFHPANKTTFNVTDTINGKLSFSEGNATNLNRDTFQTNKALQISANIHDPPGYFNDADVIYDWNVGNVYEIDTLNKPAISYNFTLADLYKIDVNISAFVPSNGIYVKLVGYFTSGVNLKDKVSNVIVSGSTKVTEGDTHQYHITCDASLPAYMCSHLSSNSMCVGALDGCDPILMSDNCSAVIVLHFNDSGTHCLSINVANDVSNSAVTTNIKVKQVLPHQKAISITVGVLFGIIASLVSIFLVAQQVKKSRRRHVEVANFDFQEDESNSTLRKFTKNVKNTCKMVSLKISSRGKKETEYRPLISMEKDVQNT